MSRFLEPSRVTTKWVRLLSLNYSLRCTTPRLIASYASHHTHQYTTTSPQQPYKVSAVFPCEGRRYSTVRKKTSDPLHILFCGSDLFSCDVLKALYNEHVDNPDLIRSIDVVVRPAKRTGRGLKQMSEPPIRSVAENRELKVHTRDTFTGWSMPTNINLIIAVSFGLFVPPRLLRAAKYGGLNLHPSLLPDLRGPAPLHHALLNNYKVTGVSLQTLDHNTFDHGVVLAQTPHHPKDPDTIRIAEQYRHPAILQSLITPAAIRLLISGLRENLHVPPYESKGWVPPPNTPLLHAPKITKRDRQLTSVLVRAWDTPKVRNQASRKDGPLVDRQEIIGPLWFFSRDRSGKQKRIIIESVEGLGNPQYPSLFPDSGDGDDDDDFDDVWNVTRPGPRRQFPAMLESPTTTSPKLEDFQFAIPFEDEQEGSPLPEGADSPNISNQSMNLVFWAPEDYSSTRSPSDFLHPRDSSSEGALYLGPYRIISLKVEGDKAKSAWDALRNFVINTGDWQAYYKRREAEKQITDIERWRAGRDDLCFSQSR